MEICDLAVIVAPDKYFTLEDALAREFAIGLTDVQGVLDHRVDSRPVGGRILATFGEDLDGIGVLREVNVYLTVFPIILPFHAHSTTADHLAAVFDTSRLIVLGPAYLGPDPGFEML
jgi:hypothetical protein